MHTYVFFRGLMFIIICFVHICVYIFTAKLSMCYIESATKVKPLLLCEHV